jgi:putative thioredoxin
MHFEQEVLAKSQSQPVLVDFWAPWCGPCRVLGPVLDRLAEQAEGRWLLVKVNTDEHPGLMQRYGVRGIPAVKLFVDGEVVDEFTGALPEYAVKQWLEKALPSEAKKKYAAAVMATDEGDEALAQRLLREALADDPALPEAKALLARLVVFEDPEEAEALAESAAFAGPVALQVRDAIKTIVRLEHLVPESIESEPAGDTYLAGIEALRSRDFDTALARLIETIGRNRYIDDDGPRKACVAVFTLLGESHPIVRKHRRAFDMSLW